jgi:hypothetical protein
MTLKKTTNNIRRAENALRVYRSGLDIQIRFVFENVIEEKCKNAVITENALYNNDG